MYPFIHLEFLLCLRIMNNLLPKYNHCVCAKLSLTVSKIDYYTFAPGNAIPFSSFSESG